MSYDQSDTAVVITDPQNDFLSPDGVTWELVGDSVTENKTVEHLEQLMQAAKAAGFSLFVSPHYYYPTDHGWQFGGTVENLMHEINMFDRSGALSLDGFAGSGADWVEPLGQYINDGETIVASPHKVYGPETNDLALQLRKRGIDKVILAGMSANLCVEAHMRQLTEDGFEVTVVKDATAGPWLRGSVDQFRIHRLRCGDHSRNHRLSRLIILFASRTVILSQNRAVPTKSYRLR
jgi:nicotinamidase-related amidase